MLDVVVVDDDLDEMPTAQFALAGWHAGEGVRDAHVDCLEHCVDEVADVGE